MPNKLKSYKTQQWTNPEFCFFLIHKHTQHHFLPLHPPIFLHLQKSVKKVVNSLQLYIIYNTHLSRLRFLCGSTYEFTLVKLIKSWCQSHLYISPLVSSSGYDQYLLVFNLRKANFLNQVEKVKKSLQKGKIFQRWLSPLFQSQRTIVVPSRTPPDLLSPWYASTFSLVLLIILIVRYPSPKSLPSVHSTDSSSLSGSYRIRCTCNTQSYNNTLLKIVTRKKNKIRFGLVNRFIYLTD